MNGIYYKCVTSSCIYNRYVVFYGEVIPNKPTCNECREPYEKINETNNESKT